jgi:pimeloyl-ACP methyl ester carboxylesterase
MRNLVVGLVGGVLVLTACGGGSGNVTAGATQTPSASTSSTPPPVKEFSVVVAGVTIAGYCKGDRTPGSPAVLLQHGNGGSLTDLNAIEEYLAARTQVCTYNRPGAQATKAPAHLPRSVMAVAVEAHAVLAAAGVAPPYFLIGQSAGAVVVDVFAHRYPREVAGFVASNPNPPYTAWIRAVSKVETKAELQSAEYPDYRGQNAERIVFTGNDVMLAPLPATMPFAVLFDEDCDGDTAFCSRILEPLSRTEALLAKVCKAGRFVWLKGAGHDIPGKRPDDVERVVDQVWKEATG